MLVETHLRDAAVALAEGRETDGFRALLDAYKVGGRTAELAAAVVTVAERLAPRHPDDPHLSAPKRYEAFDGPLGFYTLDDPTYAMWGDPRVEALVLGWLEEARFSTGGDAVQAYDRIVQALSGGGTPSVVARLSALFDRVRADASHPLRRDGPRILRALARAATKVRDEREPPLSADARLLLESIVSGGPPAARPMAALRSGDELRAAVWADPDSDDPRLVYADWLLDRGDRHGELIVLQCERARRGISTPDPRENQLLAPNLHAWLGPLAPALMVYPNRVRFERGFVAAAELSYVINGDDRALGLRGHPAWATVIELDCVGAYQRGSRAAPLILDGAMRSLRIVRELALDDARLLAKADLSSLRWTHLGIAGRIDEAQRELATQLEGLATLESLAFSWLSIDDVEAVLATPLGRRLRALATDGPEPLVEWVALADRLLARAPLALFRHDSGQHRIAFARHASGGLAVTAAMGPYGRATTYVAELLLLAPEERRVSSLTLLRPSRRKKGKDAAILDQLKGAFGHRLAIQDM